VAITPRGRKAMDAAAPAHVAAVRRYFIDLLTTTELDTLTALSQKVASVLSKTASCDED
jgi:hypothetical protein